MPETNVVLYREDDGSVPVLEWLDSLEPKAVDKCTVRLERLKELGHELRRPEADYPRDGIYELRGRTAPRELPDAVFLPRKDRCRGFARDRQRGGGAAERNRESDREEAEI